MKRPAVLADLVLRVFPRDVRAAIAAVLLSVVGVTVFISLLDYAFRTSLPASYVAYFRSPLYPRIFELSLAALIEEVKYRLILMTVLTVLVHLWRGTVSAGWMVAIIVFAQLANVWLWVALDPLYGSLRYLLVGCVWGWLYWRHGWLSAAAGHIGTHPLLDPILRIVLQP